eukprot:3901492-Amphidinium_carterae.1
MQYVMLAVVHCSKTDADLLASVRSVDAAKDDVPPKTAQGNVKATQALSCADTSVDAQWLCG